MKIILSGKNMEIGDSLRKQADKKIRKIEKYFKPNVDAQVTLSTEGYRHIVEVTIPFDGVVIRAEESTDDMYTSLDRVIEKLEKQIHKHRTKLEKKLKEGAFKFDGEVFVSGVAQAEEPKGRIIRNKRFVIKPMTEDEALTQMDLLGHSFFVFQNAETNEVNVLYKRKDGNYGLIEPEFR
jgi:putative sigma-54 modulation protein